MKTCIKTIIDIVVGVVFYIIILVSVSAITHGYIKHTGLREGLQFEIQKKDVMIEALITSCKMDYLIKIRRPEGE
jgi:hypothetical protein